MCLWSLLVLVLFLEYKPSQGRSTVLFFEYRPRMIGSFRRVFLRPRGLKQTPHSRDAPLGSETAPSLKAGLSWYFLQWFLLCDRHSQQMLGNDFFLKLFSSIEIPYQSQAPTWFSSVIFSCELQQHTAKQSMWHCSPLFPPPPLLIKFPSQWGWEFPDCTGNPHPHPPSPSNDFSLFKKDLVG